MDTAIAMHDARAARLRHTAALRAFDELTRAQAIVFVNALQKGLDRSGLRVVDVEQAVHLVGPAQPLPDEVVLEAAHLPDALRLREPRGGLPERMGCFAR